MVTVYERWHLYNGNTLVNVYAELPLLEQDVSSMPAGSYVAKKVIEMHTLHATYGMAGHPMPNKPVKPHATKQTVMNYNLVEFDPSQGG